MSPPQGSHVVRLARYHRGMTAIAPQRPVYGYHLTCGCGWKTTVNGTKREAEKTATAHKRAGGHTHGF